MTAHVLSKPMRHEHIRPFRAARDMAGLAELVEVAFGPELTLTGSNMVRDMRQVAKWGPALYLGKFIIPVFAGCVWIEGDRLVGNVTVTQLDNSDVWSLSNVAVLPEYRGRGIAGELVDWAIAHVRRRRGRRVVLQVRSNNTGAIALYAHRGFRTYDTVHELDLAGGNWPLTLGEAEPQLRGIRSGDGPGIYRVAVEGTKPEARYRKPLSGRAFQRGIGGRLRKSIGSVLSGRLVFELVALENQDIVGYGSLTTPLMGAVYELALYVHPEQQGRWEKPLMRALLQASYSLPHQRVRASISEWHAAALHGAQELGFETLRVLDQMALELG